MAKASKETTPTTMDFEIAEDRSCELEDFTVNFVTIRQDHDLAPMLASLPGGMCHCPHWGVMAKGRMTATYPDRKEVFEAGDAFYMPPGHTAAAEAGAEFIQFSPTDLLAETEAAIAKGMQEAAN
ncbi:MAG TPA: cupin domain-containing protein [Acidimicrobiia bacterium]